MKRANRFNDAHYLLVVVYNEPEESKLIYSNEAKRIQIEVVKRSKLVSSESSLLEFERDANRRNDVRNLLDVN